MFASESVSCCEALLALHTALRMCALLCSVWIGSLCLYMCICACTHLRAHVCTCVCLVVLLCACVCLYVLCCSPSSASPSLCFPSSPSRIEGPSIRGKGDRGREGGEDEEEAAAKRRRAVGSEPGKRSWHAAQRRMRETERESGGNDRKIRLSKKRKESESRGRFREGSRAER